MSRESGVRWLSRRRPSATQPRTQPTGDFFGLLFLRCTEGATYVALGVTGPSVALNEDAFRFADTCFFVGVSCAAPEVCSSFGESSRLTTTLLLLSETGDFCRAFETGDEVVVVVVVVIVAARPTVFSLPLDVFELFAVFLGVGLMVSNACASTLPALGSMSSPLFTLHEIEQ